jgi:predicted nucleotidyltransferase
MQERDRRQLGRVVTLVRDVLGRNVVGAYLLGSAVEGGLHPHSDLDVLVVCERALSRKEKRKLVDRILPISWRQTPSGIDRGIELTVVVHSDVRPWRYPPNRDFQYGDWLRLALERGETEHWAAKADPDLASLITQVLAADVALIGPPPPKVFDPVPFPDVLDAIVVGVDHWVGNIAEDTRNGILALARIWSASATGSLHSKDAAAAWALDRLPEDYKAVLARARAIYLGGEEDHWDDVREQVRGYVEYVVEEIDRLTNRPDNEELQLDPLGDAAP